MYNLYEWVYNCKLNLVGIITEKNVGRYHSEYAIYYPNFYGGHRGRGFSEKKYKSDNVMFYTEELMEDRIIPFDPRLLVTKSADNYMKEDEVKFNFKPVYSDDWLVDIF